MSRESLDDPRHNSRISLGTRRRKSGISNVVSAAIMIAAVAILGSTMLIWANTVFKAQQQTMGSTYETNSNLLKETFMVEDVWLSKSPANYVNVTIRNVGDIAINATQIQIIGLKSDGSTCAIAGCTATAKAPYKSPTGPNYSFPLNSNGVIATKTTLRVDVQDVWSDSSIKSLNIQVITARGSVLPIVWQVS